MKQGAGPPVVSSPYVIVDKPGQPVGASVMNAGVLAQFHFVFLLATVTHLVQKAKYQMNLFPNTLNRDVCLSFLVFDIEQEKLYIYF